MRVLLIKTSSMGDLIHTLPALSDAEAAIPGIKFDWLVEPGFAEIPIWHHAVDRVIKVPLRRWRKNVFAKTTRDEFNAFREAVNLHQYDLILDAQGLVKSAFLGFFAKGVRAGLDFKSARESLASFMYQKKYTVNFYQHAIVRMRNLFSLALHYSLPTTAPQFNIMREKLHGEVPADPYYVFLHGTTWESKMWPETYWMQLADLASASGAKILVSGGSEKEVARSMRLAAYNPNVIARPRVSITEMANLLVHAKGAVAVDTGFGHVAAALRVPTVSIYGSTKPAYTGAIGDKSLHLAAEFPCSPCLSRACLYRAESAVKPACYETVPPVDVWDALKILL